MTDEQAEQLIRVSAKIFVRSTLKLIYDDPHQWSDRPCQTCRSISSILGEKFGCYRYQEINKK